MAERIECHPASAERWRDIEKLFGANGACGGCWCMHPRLIGGAFRAGAGEPNKRALRAIVRKGEEPGILAYAGGEPVGWCALAPRESYPRILNSRLFGGAEVPPGTWSVVCFFIAKAQRGKGMSVRLLEAAAKYARGCGARVLEGYPIDPKARTADAFTWTGHVSAFRDAGFTEVARPSPTRPLMRRALGRTRPVARAASRPSTAAAGRRAKPRRAARADG